MKLIVLIGSMLVFIYANDIMANEVAIPEIKSIVTCQAVGKAIYNASAVTEAVDELFSTEEKQDLDGRSFRVTFMVPKGLDKNEPETLQLWVVDNNNKEHFRQKVKRGDIKNGTNICSTVESTAKKAYSCFIIDYFSKEESSFLYQKFIVKVYDDKGRIIMQLIGEKPRLLVTFEKPKLSGEEGSLVLTNKYPKEIIINKVGSGKYISISNKSMLSGVRNWVYGINLAPKQSYTYVIKASNQYPTDTKTFTDVVPIEYSFDEADLDASITVTINHDIELVRKCERLYDPLYARDASELYMQVELYREAEKNLQTQMKAQEISLQSCNNDKKTLAANNDELTNQLNQVNEKLSIANNSEDAGVINALQARLAQAIEDSDRHLKQGIVTGGVIGFVAALAGVYIGKPLIIVCVHKLNQYY